MKVVVTGGGTGGHIYPALSIARQLKEQGAELLFVGSQHGPEGRLAGLEGVPFKAVPSGPIVGMSLRTAKSLLKLFLGTCKAYSILSKYKPDVVVGTGGYTSAGVVFAEWLRGGKVVIHEQNSIPGRTNTFLGKLAKRVCVTFQESLPYFPGKKAVLTGLPVRPEILEGIGVQTARWKLQLDPNKFTVLVTGGSQGSQKINEAVLGAVSTLCGSGIQVVHLTGSRNYGDILARKPDLPGYVIAPYMDDMATAYSAADVVISRSGASTIAEITARGIPAVFIPYPFAHADHQRKNALALQKAGAAIVIDEKELTGPGLADVVMELWSDREKLANMARLSKGLGVPDAAEKIAAIVQEVTAARK